MSRTFGPIFQISYVVADIAPVIQHMLTELGVGPFYMFPLPLDAKWIEVRGERVPAGYDLLAAVAIAYSGDTMIEIIQPGSAPSMYREFLEAGRHGVHHLGTVASDYDAQMAAARAAGIEVALEGVLPFSRFAYLETDAQFPGTVIELIEMQPAMVEMFATIKQAAVDWDGADPIRQL